MSASNGVDVLSVRAAEILKGPFADRENLAIAVARLERTESILEGALEKIGANKVASVYMALSLAQDVREALAACRGEQS